VQAEPGLQVRLARLAVLALQVLLVHFSEPGQLEQTCLT
jgi:hypothetical protein